MRFVLVFLLVGCAGLENVSRGLSAAQTGMAVVDVGTDRVVGEYTKAVGLLRAYCDGDVDCEKRYHVTDADMARAEMLFERLSDGYDAAAVLLRRMGETWGELTPVLRDAKARARGLD